jgi:hypothetical protein
MLPRTDDLLARSIALSVGVVDAYLGSGFGIGPFSSPEDIAAAADALHLAVEEVMATAGRRLRGC